jgi:hypothetical protein
MTFRESQVVHETPDYWVLDTLKPGWFEVYRKGITHSTRCATVSDSTQWGKARADAVAECNRRQTACTLTR